MVMRARAVLVADQVRSFLNPSSFHNGDAVTRREIGGAVRHAARQGGSARRGGGEFAYKILGFFVMKRVLLGELNL